MPCPPASSGTSHDRHARSARPRSRAPPGAGGGGFPHQPVQPGRRRHSSTAGRDWPQASVVVVAPPRAGKTHLANVWRLKSGAARLEAGAAGRARSRGCQGRAAGRGPARRDRRRARAVPPAEPGARAQDVDAAHLARPAGRARRAPCPTCARACARCPWSPSRRRTRPCSRRCWSSTSPTGNSPWSRTSINYIALAHGAVHGGGGRHRRRDRRRRPGLAPQGDAGAGGARSWPASSVGRA